MNTQMLLAVVLGIAGLVSASFAFINLLKPKGEWAKAVDDERVVLQRADYGSSQAIRDNGSLRVRFALALLCRRLEITAQAIVEFILLVIVVFAFSLIGMFLLWLLFKSSQQPSPVGNIGILFVGLLSGLFIFAMLACILSFLLSFSIKVIESGRENP